MNRLSFPARQALQHIHSLKVMRKIRPLIQQMGLHDSQWSAGAVSAAGRVYEWANFRLLRDHLPKARAVFGKWKTGVRCAINDSTVSVELLCAKYQGVAITLQIQVPFKSTNGRCRIECEERVISESSHKYYNLICK